MFENAVVDDNHQPNELPDGYALLHGQYQIEAPLISGGFGITYLARDSLDRQVVVKECFPAGLCQRQGGQITFATPAHKDRGAALLQNFLREARYMAELEHPNIARVHQLFQENNTAYIAMERVHGADLLAICEDDRARLTPGLLSAILRQALDALAFVHGRGVLHRDIAPDNFIIDRENRLKLIDFGSASETHRSDAPERAALLSVKDGFSPHEFYGANMANKPCSDLYALGATLYYLITGEPPANSEDRLTALTSAQSDPCPPLAGGQWSFDGRFLMSIDKALSVFPAQRFQSAEDWIAFLEFERSTKDALSAAASPHANPHLDALIADLVTHTNRDLKPQVPRAQRKEAPEDLAKKATPEPKQFFDIYGNPIRDLDAWMRDQNKPKPKPKPKPRKDAKTPRPKALPKPSPEEVGAAPVPADQSQLLRQGLGDISTRRKDAKSAGS